MSSSVAIKKPDPSIDNHHDDIWAWNPSSLEFDRLKAIRQAPNTWEVVEIPSGEPGASAYAQGDLVRCELSDGELLVYERVWSGRLL